MLRAEWVKFRTVRGWVAGMLVAGLVTVGIALLNHSTCGGSVTPGGPQVVGAGCAAPPSGPGGEAVTDRYYLVHQPLPVSGSITARITSLTAGQASQAKASQAKARRACPRGPRPGSSSPRAPGPVRPTPPSWSRPAMASGCSTTTPAISPAGPGRISAASPRWLRLDRSGDTVTGYQSADGTRWTLVGTARLAGFPMTAQAGMFAASPGSTQVTSQSLSGGSGSGATTLTTARFDHLALRGSRPGGTWAGSPVGGPSPGTGFHQAGDVITVTGTGDIAPYVAGDGAAFPVEKTLLGAAAGLIAVIVVAAMFMTAEYRRGLIRVTLAASPRRGQVLAAKAIVIAAAAFVTGLAGAIAAVTAEEPLLRARGNFILPASAFTEIRAVGGTALLLAVAAVLTLALGAILRSGAAAVTTVIVTLFLPYLLTLTASAGLADWLLRLTPAAAFAIQQTSPAYPQVSASYTPGNGYFPLAPLAGFGVLCGYTALAAVLAVILLRKRDA